jgi:predicted membrane protein
VLAAAVALLVGVIVALTPTIGAWGATGLVVGVVLAVAFLLVILARNRFRGLNGEERS